MTGAAGTPAAPLAWGPDGDDTALARALHAGGAPLEALQRALADVRARRGQEGRGDGLALATALLAAGAVTPAQLEVARNHLAKTAVVAADRRPGGRGELPAAFGPYRVVRELGRGGMGVVLEVQDAAGRRGALKTLLPGADEELVARFRREARLQARLDHPHVAPIHAAAFEEGAPAYLVQDFLTGGTLAERLLTGGPLPPAEVARLGRKLAAGLQHAHERGVLHRDLKPANVLFDDRGEPRIIDFGLARPLDGASVRLTRTGEILGTPAFVAPEVLTGAGVDARTDVHGLAALLYAALTGAPPHPGGAGLFATLNAALLHDPPRASTLRPGVPGWLDEALARGLARDPAARPATAAALGAALVEPEDAGAARPGVALLGALAVVAVGLALAALTRAGGDGPPPAPATPAPSPAPSAAEALAARAQGLVDGAPLPATPAGLAALARELRGSTAGVATSAGALVALLAGEPVAATELGLAVERLALDRPRPLTRAAAAALWARARAAMDARRTSREVEELARAAALAGPEGQAATEASEYWARQAGGGMPEEGSQVSARIPASKDDPTIRADLERRARALELAWRASPTTAPYGAPGVAQLYGWLTLALQDGLSSRDQFEYKDYLAPLGDLLAAAAPSDPLFAVLAGLDQPPGLAFDGMLAALDRLDRSRPPTVEGAPAWSTYVLAHNAFVVRLRACARSTGRWSALEARLRRAIDEGRCGPATYDVLATAIVERRRAAGPDERKAARADLEALAARAPDLLGDMIRARVSALDDPGR